MSETPEEPMGGGLAYTPTTEMELLHDAFERNGVIDGKLLLKVLDYLEGRIVNAEDETYRIEQKLTGGKP